MEHTYTRQAKSKIATINNENFSTDFGHDFGDHTEELKKLVKEFDRPFSEGLALLLKRASYHGGPNDLKEKKDFLFSKYKSSGIPVSDTLKKTLSNWLDGSAFPQASNQTRDRIYQLCFALSVSTDDVNWFFHHVFFQRSFNCHRAEEAVYYYCFQNHRPYAHAQQLIAEIQSFPETGAPAPETVIYTREIQQQLERYSKDEELKEYFRQNKWAFQGGHANQRAKENISRLLEKIRGKAADKEIAIKVKNGEIKGYGDSPEIESCGLIVQEILRLHEPGALLDFLINNNDITSTPVLLKCIYGTIESKEPLNVTDIDMPPNGRRHFPYARLLDTMVKELDATENFDAVRKLLILLKFYEFWCIHDKLHPSSLPADSKIRYETYLYETNNLLTECGCDTLFAGYSYDALFMLCSGSAAPLEALRNFLAA